MKNRQYSHKLFVEKFEQKNFSGHLIMSAREGQEV